MHYSSVFKATRSTCSQDGSGPRRTILVRQLLRRWEPARWSWCSRGPWPCRSCTAQRRPSRSSPCCKVKGLGLINWFSIYRLIRQCHHTKRLLLGHHPYKSSNKTISCEPLALTNYHNSYNILSCASQSFIAVLSLKGWEVIQQVTLSCNRRDCQLLWSIYETWS